MLKKMHFPSWIATTMVDNSSSTKIIEAASLLTSVPVEGGAVVLVNIGNIGKHKSKG